MNKLTLVMNILAMLYSTNSITLDIAKKQCRLFNIYINFWLVCKFVFCNLKYQMYL